MGLVVETGIDGCTAEGNKEWMDWGIKMNKERKRGHGSLYQQKNRDGELLPTWWCRYYSPQFKKIMRVSTGHTDFKKAEKFLDLKIAEAKTKTDTDPKRNKVTVDDLYAWGLERYKTKKRKSLPDFEARWRLHLQPFFGGRKASQVSGETILAYISHRQSQNVSDGLINRELAALKMCYNHAAKRLKKISIDMVPYFDMLEEDENGRTDFLKDEDYPKMADAFGRVGLWARAMFETGCEFGFRKSELLNLRVRYINLPARTITLPGRSTKNKKSRLVVMTQLVYQLLKPLVTGKKPDDHVFTRENGKPVKDFQDIWERCCIEAGCGRYVCSNCAPPVIGECKEHGTEHLRWMDKAMSKKYCLSCAPTIAKQCPTCEKATRIAYDGLLVHGLRRTAAINMAMADLPKHWAKQIGGWQEDKMFDRYSKMAHEQMQQATQKLETSKKARMQVISMAATEESYELKRPIEQARTGSYVPIRAYHGSYHA